MSLRMRRRRRRVGGWGGPAAPTPFIWPLRRRRQPDLGAKLCAKLRRAGGGLGPATRSSAEPRDAPPPADLRPPAGRAPRWPEDTPLRHSPGPHLDVASQSRGGCRKPKQQQDKKLAGGRSGRGPSGRHPSPGSCGAGRSRSHARSDQSAFRTATQKRLQPVRRRPGGFTPTGTDFTKPHPSSAGSNTNPHSWPKMPPLAQPRSNQGMDVPAPLPAQRAPPHGPAPWPAPPPLPTRGRGAHKCSRGGLWVAAPRAGGSRAVISRCGSASSALSLGIRASPTPPPRRDIFHIPLGTALFGGFWKMF